MSIVPLPPKTVEDISRMGRGPLEENVTRFLEKAGNLVAAARFESFALVAAHTAISSCTSPIERLMVIAFEAMRHLHYVDVRRAFDLETLTTYAPPKTKSCGVTYWPQAGVHRNYTADFIVRGAGMCKGSDIAVELDGHDFHDRDQKQRSYEKRRDRDFQKAGLRVFRYTGADVVRDPLAVATEIFKALKAI